MNLFRRVLARAFRLPPAETHDLQIERNLRIPMPDGVVLLADHYTPRALGPRPTILTRSVYTDRTKGGWVSALIAERGFHVLVVSGRGTVGSGGTFNPFRHEHDDGLAVLAWLQQQPWFTGDLGTTGASYLGYTQWAIARDVGPMLKAMSTQLIGSDLRRCLYPGDGFALETLLFWLAMVDAQERPLWSYFLRLMTGSRRRRTALTQLPLGTLDQMTTGRSSPFWRDWLTHDDPDDPWWEAGNHSGTIAEVQAPNHLIGGWHDFFLPQLLRDYQALAAAGRQPYLTIGPWLHTDVQAAATGMREGLIWLHAHLLSDRTGLRAQPVRIFVQGANMWRDLPTWPPATLQPRRWYLQPQGRLAREEPPVSGPDYYRYDPRDPTPSVGAFGRFAVGGTALRDNRSLESRPDVLVYTSAPLPGDMDLMGPVSAEIWLRSNLAHTDVFVRLCDVQPSGKSLTICDGLQRLRPDHPARDPDGCVRVSIALWPTAYRIRRGHCLRVQVSSGAFPRWSRNLGTSEPALTATTMQVAHQAVYHDPTHPSSITLPIVD